MKVKCPKCGSNFEINDKLIKSRDVKFKCYKCGFLWITNVDKANDTQNTGSVYQNNGLYNNNLPNKSFQNYQAQNNTSKQNYITFWIIGIIGFFVALSLILILFGSDLSKSIGKLEMPKTFLSSDKKYKTPLEIEIEKPIQSVHKAGKDLLIIKGRVINSTDRKQNIPPITIELKNRNKEILQQISRQVAEKQINPRSDIKFTFMVDRYSKTIVSVEVNFDKEYR